MKLHLTHHLMAALLGVVFTAELSAQTSAFTYQGRLSDNGQPASGSYDLVFSLHDAETGGNQVGASLTNTGVAVSNGLFTIHLDFGAGVFTGENRWLKIGARDGGNAGPFELLGVRQLLMPAPYAHHAYSLSASNLTGTVPMANLPPDLVRSDGSTVELTGLVRFRGPVEFDQSSGPPFAVVSGAELVPGLNAEMLGWRTAEGFWQTGGNTGTAPGTHFLGTTDDRALVMKVNSQRALMLSPKGDSWTSSDGEPDGAVNIVAGSPANYVGWSNPLFDAVGVTISGGGASNLNGVPQPNRASGDYSTIGGGADQNIAAEAAFATIGGGHQNAILAGSESATIGGGDYNWIFDRAYEAVIAGGAANAIGANSAEASIGGGVRNRIEADTRGGTISGGTENGIHANAWWATVSGGFRNLIQTGAEFAVIGGGSNNVVQAQAPQSFIGGGMGNRVGESTRSAVIGGGELNSIQTNAYFAFIGGGFLNVIESESSGSAIAGGMGNMIRAPGRNNVLGGGARNQIRGGAYSSTVGGGTFNAIESPFSVVGGGENNQIVNDPSLIADHATIGGGRANEIWGADSATISGGKENLILEGAGGAAISGGFANVVLTNARYGTIPGGHGCRVGYNAGYALAAGRGAHALHPGAFVWADASQDETAPFSSSSSNQFLVRATGGVGINATNPAAALDIRVQGSEAASVHVGGEGLNGLGKLVYFGNIPYVSIGEQGVDDQMVLTAGSFYFDNNSGSGRVGLGRSATANKLEIEGDASKTTAGLWLANSDARIKRDIRSLTNALETLARVRPVRFRYTEAYRAAHPGIADRDYVNVVAQEFQEVFPDSVKTSGETLSEGGDEIRQVDTYPLLIYSTAAIQELNQIVEMQRTELRAKDHVIGHLQDRLERLEQLVARQFTRPQQ